MAYARGTYSKSEALATLIKYFYEQVEACHGDEVHLEIENDGYVLISNV